MSAYLQQAGVDVAETRTAYSQLQDLNKRYGDILLDGGLAAGGLAPPPWGTAADVVSLGRSWTNGTWGDVFFDVIGFVPVLDLVKGARTGIKLNDLRRGVDAANTAMGRVFQSTKDAAAKYWDDLMQSRKAAYDQAVAACGRNKACRDSKAPLKGPQYANTPTDGPNGAWRGERGDSVWQPTNGGPPITYTNGFPNYGPYSGGNVEIAMRGNTTTDFTAARDAMRVQTGDPNWTKPSNMTWHHKEDGVTMQLIPKSIHATGGGASTPHMGGASLYDGSNQAGF